MDWFSERRARRVRAKLRRELRRNVRLPVEIDGRDTRERFHNRHPLLFCGLVLTIGGGAWWLLASGLLDVLEWWAMRRATR